MQSIDKVLMQIGHIKLIKSENIVSESNIAEIAFIRDKPPTIPTITDKYFFEFTIIHGNKKYNTK